MLFERLDWRPFGIRPVLPIAATQPPGEATRLDSFRGGARRAMLLERLALADGDAPLAEALDRWELSLFQNEPFRSEQLRGALVGLLGETWELRAAVLLGDASDERRAIHAALRSLAAGEQASARAEDAVRRSLVETLRHGDRACARALARRRAARAARRRRCVRAKIHVPVTSRSAFGTGRSLASAAWTKLAFSPGSTGSTRSTGRARRPGELLAELRGLLREAEEQVRERAAATGDGEEVVERSAQRLLGT